MQYTVDRSRMPRHIYDWMQVHPVDVTKSWYELYWDGPNQEIGSCRVSPIQGLCCQSKSLVMLALRLAYGNAWPIKSFDEALEIIHGQGLRLILCTPKGKRGQMMVDYQYL